MANANNSFQFKGTRVFHGVSGAAFAVCRFLSREATTGKLVHCPSAVRPLGVSAWAAAAAGESVDYHKQGQCTVETDGSAAVGDSVKADASGTGKAIKDSSPGITTAGVLVSLDTTTNIGMVELYV